MAEKIVYERIKIVDMSDDIFMQVAAIMKEGFPDEYCPYRETRDHITCELQDSEDDPHTWWILATQGDTVVGAVALKEYDDDCCATYMFWLAVKAEHRRKGVGRKLFDMVVSTSPQDDNVVFDVDKDSLELIDMYQRWGATIYEETETDTVMRVVRGRKESDTDLSLRGG